MSGTTQVKKMTMFKIICPLVGNKSKCKLWKCIWMNEIRIMNI